MPSRPSFTNPTEETIERVIEEYRKYEQDQAELHKQQQERQTGATPEGAQPDGGFGGGTGAKPEGGGPQSTEEQEELHKDPPYTGDGDEEEPTPRRKHGDWTGTYQGTGMFTAGRNGNGAQPEEGHEDEEEQHLDEAEHTRIIHRLEKWGLVLATG